MGRGAHPRTCQRHEDKAAALDPACSSWDAGDVGRLKPFYVVLLCLLSVDSLSQTIKSVYDIVLFLTVSPHRNALFILMTLVLAVPHYTAHR